MKLLATCAIIMATAAVAQAQTVTIFQSGFEPAEGYSPGNLNGQNGWSAFLGDDPNFGGVTSTNPLSGLQSVLLDGQHVLIGTAGNYAGIGHAAVVVPNLNGAPLRYVEITGLGAIVDPTIDPNHHSRGGPALYFLDEDFITFVGARTNQGLLNFGWQFPNTNLPVDAGTTFQFRYLLDYQTGFASAWQDGQVVFQNLNNVFFPAFIPTEFYLEMFAFDNLLPFDTRVWYDDIHMKAIYGCAADTNSDAEINVDDLIAVILGWGPCPKPPAPCLADINQSGAVDVDDLIGVILGWGSCD